jgi:hypothetical protein
MKSIKIMFSILAAVVIAVPAFADTTIKPKGSLQYRVMSDSTTTNSGVANAPDVKSADFGPTTDGGLKIGFDATSGNLSAAIQTSYNAAGTPTAAENAKFGIEESWIQYAFKGIGSLKVNIQEADTGYNCDIYGGRVQDSMSLKFAADAGFFATIQSQNAPIDTKTNDVKSERSTVPVIEVGYGLKVIDALTVNAGVAIDKTGKGDTAAATAANGFLPWANLSYSAGIIGFDLAGQYSKDCARISATAGKGTTYGVQAKVTVKPNDLIEFYVLGRYMSAKAKGAADPTNKMYLESIITYKYDANINFSAGLNEYSSEKTGDKKTDKLNIRLFQVGYSI